MRTMILYDGFTTMQEAIDFCVDHGYSGRQETIYQIVGIEGGIAIYNSENITGTHVFNADESDSALVHKSQFDWDVLINEIAVIGETRKPANILGRIQ